MDGDIELDHIDFERTYRGEFIGCQIMDGDIDVFLGIAGNDKELLKVASTFAQEVLKSLMQMHMMHYVNLLMLLMVHMQLSSVRMMWRLLFIHRYFIRIQRLQQKMVSML